MKNIIFGDNVVTLMDSLYITVVSMVIVFAILLLISVILDLLKVVAKFGGPEEEVKPANKKKQVEKVQPAVVSQPTYQFENLKNKIEDEGVRLAILTASIHTTEEFGHNNIRINYVREV